MEAGKIMLRESNQELENHLDQFKSSYKQVRNSSIAYFKNRDIFLLTFFAES